MNVTTNTTAASISINKYATANGCPKNPVLNLTCDYEYYKFLAMFGYLYEALSSAGKAKYMKMTLLQQCKCLFNISIEHTRVRNRGKKLPAKPKTTAEFISPSSITFLNVNYYLNQIMRYKRQLCPTSRSAKYWDFLTPEEKYSTLYTLALRSKKKNRS